jgi:hypothetical protein
MTIQEISKVRPQRLQALFGVLPLVALPLAGVLVPLAPLLTEGCAANQASLDATGSSTPTTASATAGAVAPPPPATAGAPPLTTVLTTDPQQLQQMFAGAAGAPSASLAPGGSIGDPIEGGIRNVAAKLAPGMQPEGPIAKGTLQEKGHAEMMATLEVGKCYAIVGFSPQGGVADLDLHLLSPPLYNILTGEDTTDDNMPVIAKAPNPMCPAMAVPLPYKVDIFADRGAGAFGVQLYSRAK